MSHLLAARCTVCGVVDDPTCPECRKPSAALHGTTNQMPWRHVAKDGYVYEWHPECFTNSTTNGAHDEQD